MYIDACEWFGGQSNNNMKWSKLPAPGPVRHALVCVVLLGAVAVTGSARGELAATPGELKFNDAFARRQLLVHDGELDLTRDVQYESSDPKVVAVDAAGYVTPKANGNGHITIHQGQNSIQVPFAVTDYDNQRRIDFATEIVPLLSRYRLQLGRLPRQGQRTERFQAVAVRLRSAVRLRNAGERGPRTAADVPAAPGHSLLLRKGDRRSAARRRTAACNATARPIRCSCAGSSPALPPSSTRMRPPSTSLVDHTRRADHATRRPAAIGRHGRVQRRQPARCHAASQYSSNLDVVAAVDEQGLVDARRTAAKRRSWPATWARWPCSGPIVPHGAPLAELPDFRRERVTIDRLAAEKWKKLGLMPSPLCDDATFLRRVTIDLCGRLPTVDETHALSSPTRRPTSGPQLIDRLLDSPDYPAYFAMRWGSDPAELEPGRRRSGGLCLSQLDQGHDRPQPPLRRVRARRRGGGRRMAGRAGDQLVLADARRSTASGHRRHGPGLPGHAAAMRPLPPSSVRTLGPGRLLRPGRVLHAPGPQEFRPAAAVLSPPATSTTGEKNPLTGKVAGAEVSSTASTPKFTPEEDPRHALVDWMAKPDNPFFAKALVNRMWGHFLGRGLVHEVDDMRETNPPSNPECSTRWPRTSSTTSST